MLKIFNQMLQGSYSQTVPIKSSFATKLIPYPWIFLLLIRETGLEEVFLDFVTSSPICSILCGVTSFLGSHSQLCRLFPASCQLL